RAWRPGRAAGKHEVVAVNVEAGPKDRRRARRQCGSPKRQLGRPGETASEDLHPGPAPRRPTAWAHPAHDRWPGRAVGEGVEGVDQAGARADAHPDVECSHRAGRTDSRDEIVAVDVEAGHKHPRHARWEARRPKQEGGGAAETSAIDPD